MLELDPKKDPTTGQKSQSFLSLCGFTSGEIMIVRYRNKENSLQHAVICVNTETSRVNSHHVECLTNINRTKEHYFYLTFHLNV